LVVKEAAILFESGRYKDCDFVITITAPEADRISRVLKRDATTLDNIQKRMSHQWTDAQRIEKSDFVIQNTDLQEAENRLVNIINSLIKSKK
jgi:dephospho-CoA kinase